MLDALYYTQYVSRRTLIIARFWSEDDASILHCVGTRIQAATQRLLSYGAAHAATGKAKSGKAKSGKARKKLKYRLRRSRGLRNRRPMLAVRGWLERRR